MSEPAATDSKRPRRRVVLADDHDVVRKGVRALLQDEDHLDLVGEAEDGLELVSLVDELEPDILIVDIRMPGLDGLEVTRRVRERHPKLLVIILSMYRDEAYVLRAFRNGASAYVLKEARSTDLLDAIEAASAGEKYLSPPLSEGSIQDYMERAAEVASDPYEKLTAREREVLQLAAEGNSNPEIAERLGLSPRTVETHRANLMRKLGVRGQTELVRYALRRGIIRSE